MTAYTVLRFNKLKSWGAVGGAGSHNARLRQTLNADPEALSKNRFLIGSPGDDLAAICQTRLGDQKIRKNAVYAVEGVMSASPVYFRPDNPEKYGHHDPARLKTWVDASMSWLREKYGDRVISAVLHLDEATPHIQFLILPLDEHGKLNCRRLFGGSRQVMADLQTEYADAVAHLGLSRGRAGSKAQHQDVALYYAATQNLDQAQAPDMLAQGDIYVPEPPGITARLKDKNLTDYARGTAAKAVEEHTARFAPVMKALTDRDDMLTAEVKRLKEEQERLKTDNARLSRENGNFKAEAKKMRGLPLDVVLSKMFGATESKNSNPHTRRFELPDGAVILFTDNQWHDLSQGAKGRGAVNLVMNLSGYGQEHYKQAVRDMAGIFGDLETTTSLVYFFTENANREFLSVKRGQFQKPPASDLHWPVVREFLVEQLKLPEAMIDQAHENGLIYSDSRKNCVFLRDQESGAFVINTKGRPFTRSLGQGGGPFELAGSDKTVYITDTPADALGLKAIHPESTILAAGGFLPKDKMKPYLEGREKIFLAQGRDKAGEEYARNLAKDFPQAKRLLPERGQTWSEERRLQKEEKERAAILPLEPAPSKASPVERADETLKPAAGLGRGVRSRVVIRLLPLAVK